MAWKKALPSCASRKQTPLPLRRPGHRAAVLLLLPVAHHLSMKAAFQIAFTVYGIAAVIALFVAALIQGLFVVVRRFSR